VKGNLNDNLLYIFVISGNLCTPKWGVTMRRRLVAGNWKMNGTKQSVADLVAVLEQHNQDIPVETEVVVCPPYVFLDQVAQSLSGSVIALGAQNVSAEQNGAFTGEISTEMLRQFNCEYVIVGHSERRMYYAENNNIVAKKAEHAAKSGLKPIICLGESLAEREQNATEFVIDTQLSAILALDSVFDLMQNAVFAYEPIWAIGTGITASPSEAQAVHAFIRKRLAEFSPAFAQQVRIIYGGSVKASNSPALFAMPDIDGALVGGASLNAQEFLDICRCIN
jgi:triosephosphate isomerase (TIM)